jgi:uncharacterized protein YwqG
MSFLKRLFGRAKPDGAKEKGIEEQLAYLNTLRKSAIALQKSAVTTFSRMGGLPALPAGMPWPEWKGVPLAFLCQLDLHEIPERCIRNGLPAAGVLYFFYNQEQETWGFDPKDKGSWQVIYTASASQECVERPAPALLASDYIYPEKHLMFTPVETYPDWQDERINALDLSDSQSDEYIDMCSAVFQNQPSHHLFGYPDPVQGNDMDLECQLVSSGLYCGDATGYNDTRAKQLESGRSDWLLLLQLDSDDDAGMMWGDCGMLYFWIRQSDLAQARFDSCWMILQCS